MITKATLKIRCWPRCCSSLTSQDGLEQSLGGSLLAFSSRSLPSSLEGGRSPIKFFSWWSKIRCIHGSPMSTKKFLLLTLKMHVEVTQVQLKLTWKMEIVISRFLFSGILSLCPSVGHPVGDDLERCKSLFSNRWLQHQINIKYISGHFEKLRPLDWSSLLALGSCLGGDPCNNSLFFIAHCDGSKVWKLI